MHEPIFAWLKTLPTPALMSDVTAPKIIEELEKEKYKPIYFLQGDEPFYIDQVIHYITNHTLSQSERSLNLLICYGKEHLLSKLISHARTFPMMGKRKVIILKNAQDIDELQSKRGQDILIEYLNRPHENNILVFSYKHKKLPPHHPLTQAIATKGILLTTSKIYESQIPQWIANHVASLGYHITPQASITLQGLVGNNLQLLDGELRKILINFEAGTTLQDEDITKYVSLQKELNNFALQNALSERNPHKTMQILNQFAQSTKQTSLLILLSLLTTFFGKVLQLYNKTTSDRKTLAAQLQVHPYFIHQYLLATRSYTLLETIQVLHHLHRADIQIKGIQSPYLSEVAILEELVAKILLEKEK